MGASNSLTYHEFLGGGAYGRVYRVTWKSQQFGTIEAAAKKIPINGEITEQQKREIEYLKKLDHRNIIRYYDTIIEEEHVVIVTEFAAKGSLYNYLKDKDKLPQNLLHQWIYHLACAVNYIKTCDVAHRDLKSPNCIISAEDVLKICDFGIAKDLTSTTETEHFKGSVRWMAPELLTDSLLSPKADIFAFGIIVWEMVSCDRPYKNMMGSQVMYQVMQNDIRPKIPDECPQFLRELIEQCWHRDRTQRPDSAEVVKRVRHAFRQSLTEADGKLNWGHLANYRGCICHDEVLAIIDTGVC